MTTMQHNPKRVGPTNVASRLLGAWSHLSRSHQETVAFAAERFLYLLSEQPVAQSTGMGCDPSGIRALGLAADQPGTAILA